MGHFRIEYCALRFSVNIEYPSNLASGNGRANTGVPMSFTGRRETALFGKARTALIGMRLVRMAAELVIRSYKDSFLVPGNVAGGVGWKELYILYSFVLKEG